jgi:hypothetical protein
MGRIIPRWRKMTWVILIWTAIFVIWTIAGINDRPSQNCAPGDQLCHDASDTGTGIAVALIWILWFVGFIVLSIIWFMTRPKGRRDCPVCGHSVKPGEYLCKNCGYDFRTGHQVAAAADARFDPSTGRPVAPPSRFDPQTGQPIGPRPRFDPYTGKPLDSQ